MAVIFINQKERDCVSDQSCAHKCTQQIVSKKNNNNNRNIHTQNKTPITNKKKGVVMNTNYLETSRLNSFSI